MSAAEMRKLVEKQVRPKRCQVTGCAAATKPVSEFITDVPLNASLSVNNAHVWQVSRASSPLRMRLPREGIISVLLRFRLTVRRELAFKTPLQKQKRASCD